MDPTTSTAGAGRSASSHDGINGITSVDAGSSSDGRLPHHEQQAGGSTLPPNGIHHPNSTPTKQQQQSPPHSIPLPSNLAQTLEAAGVSSESLAAAATSTHEQHTQGQGQSRRTSDQAARILADFVQPCPTPDFKGKRREESPSLAAESAAAEAGAAGPDGMSAAALRQIYGAGVNGSGNRPNSAAAQHPASNGTAHPQAHPQTFASHLQQQHHQQDQPILSPSLLPPQPRSELDASPPFPSAPQSNIVASASQAAAATVEHEQQQQQQPQADAQAVRQPAHLTQNGYPLGGGLLPSALQSQAQQAGQAQAQSDPFQNHQQQHQQEHSAAGAASSSSAAAAAAQGTTPLVPPATRKLCVRHQRMADEGTTAKLQAVSIASLGRPLARFWFQFRCGCRMSELDGRWMRRGSRSEREADLLGIQPALCLAPRPPSAFSETRKHYYARTAGSWARPELASMERRTCHACKMEAIRSV